MTQARQNACNARKTVGTRLHRVRHSWNRGPRVINHGRDAIGSLPFFMLFCVLGASFNLLESMVLATARVPEKHRVSALRAVASTRPYPALKSAMTFARALRGQ